MNKSKRFCGHMDILEHWYANCTKERHWLYSEFCNGVVKE